MKNAMCMRRGGLNRATRHEHSAATRGPGMAGRPDGGVMHPGEARAPLRLEPGAPGGLVAVERATRSGELEWPDGLGMSKSRKYGEATFWYGHPTSAGNNGHVAGGGPDRSRE